MKEIKQEKTTYIYKYEAIDGTVFEDKTECEKYENSAKGVLLSKYKSLVVQTILEEDLTYYGSCDSYVDIVKVTSENDITTILQLMILYWNSNEDSLKRSRNICEKALNNKDYVLINRGYENDNFYVFLTLHDLANQILNICKNE